MGRIAEVGPGATTHHLLAYGTGRFLSRDPVPNIHLVLLGSPPRALVAAAFNGPAGRC